MIGQSFDSVFIYLQDVTNKYNADNRLNYGVSKELVANILRDMGVKIYQNNFSSDDLYSALIGFTPSGSLYNLPFTTTQLPVSANSFLEYIDTYVTASATGSLIPTEDINFETYKRIYANLPLLLKKKGSTQGLRNLITTYGIPDTILRVNEFGGQDRNTNTADFWQNTYNYSLLSNATSSNAVYIPFKNLNTNFGGTFPQAIEIRIKPGLLPSSSIPYSQSIIGHSTNGLLLSLEYTGSGYATASYDGGPVDSYYQYANLVFGFDSNTASVYLPFFNGEWWSILINAAPGTPSTYTLYASSKTEGYNGGIAYEASSSFTNANFWNTLTVSNLVLNTSSVYSTKNYNAFSGSYQEFRYYNTPLSKSAFDAYVLNPNSIEGNTLNTSKDTLAFRLSLGGELYTGSTSIHPVITGSSVTQSFAVAPYTASFRGTTTFIPNTEVFYYEQAPVGIQNIVSNKLQTQNLILPYSGSNDSNIPSNLVLSPYISIQQSNPLSSSYSRNVDYVEVGFSPQNEINEDINSSLGFFNIGEYIGDPRQVSSSADSYPDLNTLRDSYFSKYISNYQEWDYVRLIQFFDNSLFKMIADWVPARTSLAAGIIIKQHLLERNKYPVPQADISSSIANIASGSTNVPFYQQNIISTGSIPMESVTGNDGGTLPNMNGQTSSIILPGNYNTTVTQVWTGSTNGPLGPVTFTDSYQYEFFDGTFNGSTITVTTQSLTSIQDYDVLINNVSSSRTSSFYLDVDYTQQNILPVNQQVLINNTATHATVQDSNYTLARNINPRYVGSKNTSAKYNVYTVGDSSYGKKAAIDTYADYFVYFDWIGGSNPEYPGGGNIHLTYLIDKEGKATPLTGDNTNLFTVSNIFVQGQTATILPAVYSGTSNPVVTVLEGGALIDTIVFRSGSVIGAYGVNWDNNGIGFSTAYSNTAFTQSFTNILTDSGSSGAIGWLFPFLTGSSITQGIVSTYQMDEGLSSIYLINKYTLTAYPQSSFPQPTPSGTYLPLQTYDFIRFGNTSGQSMDSRFIGNGLYQITSINIGSDYTISSSLGVYPLYTSSTSIDSNPLAQNWRLMRRVPLDNFVLVKNMPAYTDSGFLIPQNYNPTLDPYALARKAGIIQ